VEGGGVSGRRVVNNQKKMAGKGLRKYARRMSLFPGYAKGNTMETSGDSAGIKSEKKWRAVFAIEISGGGGGLTRPENGT